MKITKGFNNIPLLCVYRKQYLNEKPLSD